jgi:aspartyl-tRNA(Asn)/glutamyl-tRNA(Gln) amidotransferase subunit A
VFPLAPSLDHAGPMARTPADVRLLYEALAGPVGAEAALRIGVCPDLHQRPLEPGIRVAYEAAADTLGAATLEVPFPESERIYGAFATIQQAEAHAVHAKLFSAHPDAYGTDVRARLESAARVTLADYVEATSVREAVRGRFAAVFDAVDLLLTPISAVPPEPIGEGAQSFRDAVLPFTVPQDLAGLPAAAVPVGFDDQGLPVGVQLTGPAGSEGRVLAAAERLFTAMGTVVSGSFP